MGSIKINFLYNAILNVVNILFPVVTIPYVSRILGVEQIGIFSFVTTIVSYFSLFAALGMPLYGTREIAKRVGNQIEINNLFNELFSINVISSLVFTTLFLISVYVVPAFVENRSYFLISGISLYFCAFNIDWFYSGIENFRLITFRSIVVKLLMIVCLFLFVKSRNDLSVYILLNSLALLGNQLWNILSLRYSGFKIKFTVHSLKKHIHPLVILLFSAIAMQIYLMIDTVMLGFMSDYTELGLYSSAIKSIRIIMPLTIALSVVLLPRLSYLKENGSKEEASGLLNKAFEIITLFSVPLVFFFFAVSDKFVPFFFGTEYVGAIVPMKICSLLIWIGNMSYFSSVQILAMFSYENKFLLSTVAGMFVNILGNLFLIPAWGAVGASVASVMGEISVTFVAFFYIYRYHLFEIRWGYLFKCVISSFSFAIFAVFMYSVELGVVGWLIVYSVLSWGAYLLIQSLIFKNTFCIRFLRFKFSN